MDVQNQLNYISSYTSKLLRSKFGRGPESCSSSLGEKFLVLYIKGFVSPMEEVLIQEKQDTQVDYLRYVVIKSILDELKGVIQVTLEKQVAVINHDWIYPNNTGVIIVEFEGSDSEKDKNFEVDIAALEEEVSRLSWLVQKVPDVILTYQVTPKMFVVKRIGILVAIEKALLEKGFESELYLTKDELEKSYFHRDGNFNDIFKRPVQEIFIDWNLRENTSVICFILR